MRLSEAEARRRLAGARVVRLATADERGRPHLVPVTFAVAGDVLVTAVDHKPKERPGRPAALRRLANIRVNDRVCALADVWDEDWSRLWWVRADGRAEILTGADRDEPLARLAARYPQYRAARPGGPVIRVAVERWSGWTAS
jgi:PPOX class probable F420-dependent enzyme